MSRAIFVDIDPLDPKSAFLAIKISSFKQSFRWPLSLIKPEMTQRDK